MKKSLLLILISIILSCTDRAKTKVLCNKENCSKIVNTVGNNKTTNYITYSKYDNYFYNDKKTYGVNFREASVGGGGTDAWLVSVILFYVPIPYSYTKFSNCNDKMIFKGIYTNQQYSSLLS